MADPTPNQSARFFQGTPTTPPLGTESGVYQHSKGGLYRVLTMARNSTNTADREWLVVYVSLTYGEVFVRDHGEFCEEVEWPDGVRRPRFVSLGPARMAPRKATLPTPEAG